MAKKTKDNYRCEMYLYGVIGSGQAVDANVIVREIEARRKEGVNSFIFYVNSEGGEVTQGNTLFNYLDRTDIEVTWVVDGIAASMMAMLISNPKHTVKAAKYAKFMYHRVQGYVYGNSDEVRAAADMMDNFETSLIDMMAARCKKSAYEIRAAYFNGTDHWLSAEQAQSAGLCDEILNLRNTEIKELKNITTSRDAFNYFNNQILNLNKSMQMEKSKEFASILNIAEVRDEDDLAVHVTNVVKEKNNLTTALDAEKRKNAELENRIKEFERGKVTGLINQAVADKKIGEDERETYTKLAEKDFESTEKILNRMKPVVRVVNQLEDNNVPDAQKNWGFDEYHKAGKLQNLKKDNPELYNSLFEAKFGHKPNN